MTSWRAIRGAEEEGTLGLAALGCAGLRWAALRAVGPVGWHGMAYVVLRGDMGHGGRLDVEVKGRTELCAVMDGDLVTSKASTG
jgi:hypothetical protein